MDGNPQGMEQYMQGVRVQGHGHRWGRFLPRLSFALSVVGLLFAFAGLFLLFLNLEVPKSDRWGFWGFQSLMGIAATANGVMITRRYPRHPIGWMLLLAGLSAAVTGFSEEFSLFTKYQVPKLLPVGVLVAGLFNWWWILGYAFIAIFIPLFFPNGRLLSPAWRLLVWMGVAWVVIGALWMIVYPGPLPNNGDLPNPFGLTSMRGSLLTNLDPRSTVPIAGMFLMMGAAGSLLLRYRSALDSVTRRQLKWLAFASLMTPFAGAVGFESGMLANLILFALAVSPIVAITVAILRYRLYDIDLLINRTLVYAALTLLISALYVIVVGTVGTLFRLRNDLLVSLLATGLAATLFQPLRQRLQRVVNRIMYGDRDDPTAVLTRLGEHLKRTGSPESALESIVETIAQALKLPYVVIELGERPAVAVSYGLASDRTLCIPLVHRGETVGQLRVARRGPGEDFTPQDRRLLETIAHQAGAVAQAVRLTADLHRLHQRLLTAREEERRRIRRDLHDGLGPRLASLTLMLDAARNHLHRDLPAADALLAGLRTELQEAIADIRRLVYALRPPVLDALGLVGALKSYTDTLGTKGRPRFTVDADQDLTHVPPAVEAAVYRIAQEALTNVDRHARAQNCLLRLRRRRGFLCLEVIDDGVGFSAASTPGLGLASMRERASELGGRCGIENPPGGGTRVWAELPLGEGAYGRSYTHPYRG